MPASKPSVAIKSTTGRGSLRSAERRSEPPLHTTKVRKATTGRTEPPHSTIVADVTEFTLADDWVRRTPKELLILPPPPQFADHTPSTHHPTLASSAMPIAAPSRSHTAASVTRLSRSRIAAPATPPAVPLAPETPPPTPPRRKETCSYAAAVASPTSPTHTTPLAPITEAPTPLLQPTPPAIVVKRLPNWVGHFRTIAEALGHLPNARAHLKGVKFEPKTEEEFRTVLCCLEEAAAKDSEIDFKPPERRPADLGEGRGHTPTPTPTHHTSIPHTPTLPGATQLPAPAVPREDAPPETASAVITASDVTRAEASPDTPAPGGRRRRRQRAPRSSRPPVEPKRRVLLPTPKPPPQVLDSTVRTIVEALITGIAAYLHEQGAMPYQWPNKPHGHMPRWQARAGAIPAQKSTTGEEDLPRARPG